MVKVNLDSPVLVTECGHILYPKIGLVVRPSHYEERFFDVSAAISRGGAISKAYRVNNQLEAVGEPYTDD